MLRRIRALLASGQLDDTRTTAGSDTDSVGNLIMEKTTSGITRIVGKTVPTDATAGYAIGCLFQHVDGGAGTSLYANEGTVGSCDFDAVTVA